MLQHSKYAHKAAGLVLFLLCTECAMLFLFQVSYVFVVASDVRAGRLSFFLKLCLVYQVSLVYLQGQVFFVSAININAVHISFICVLSYVRGRFDLLFVSCKGLLSFPFIVFYPFAGKIVLGLYIGYSETYFAVRVQGKVHFLL